MPRGNIADHIMFDECIEIFRSSDERKTNSHGPSHSYLLLDFHIDELWSLPHCTIYPAVDCHLDGPYSACISKVENPEFCEQDEAHMYGIALSAIISFATMRPCKSNRQSNLYNDSEGVPDNEIKELSILHPILTAGPGSTSIKIPKDHQKKYEHEVSNLITKLYQVPYPTYIVIMQAIRLVHLSLLNKREDFGLAYLLVISAIEAVAQRAISKKKVAQKHPTETVWAERALNDPDFSELLEIYKKANSHNNHLKERYIRFIETFSPAAEWEQIVPHQNQLYADIIKELKPSHDPSQITEKSIWEKYPSDLTSVEITKIISDSYTHRSCFIHRGEQPPHQYPINLNRFFQEIYELKEGESSTRLLPNYELLVRIAQNSILNWMSSMKQTQPKKTGV